MAQTNAPQEQGLSEETAARLTTLVPLAFGRGWLDKRGAQLAPHNVVYCKGLPGGHPEALDGCEAPERP
ncbi:MAG: hypothetical protein AB1Z98_07920 [Nannocystaceae bacterium]